MKKKYNIYKFYIFIIFIIFVLIYSILFIYNNKKYLNRIVFKGKLSTIYDNAINNDYSVMYYNKDKDCGLNSLDNVDNDISYYVEFDKKRNIVNFYAYDNNWSYVGKNVDTDYLFRDSDISKTRKVIIECNGFIIIN